MTSPQITLAAFDIAGTTVDEGGAVYHALADAARAAGGDPSPADITTWMGAGKREALHGLLTGADGTAPTADRVEGAFVDFGRRLEEAYAATPPRPIEGAVDTLNRLKEAGVRIALTTGFDRDVTQGILDVLGWDEALLDAVVTIEDVALGRPAPYLIFRAMEATRTPRTAEVLVAGDTARDVQAGRNAGAGLVVGVLTGGVPAADLRAEVPDHVLSSITEIPALLGLG